MPVGLGESNTSSSRKNHCFVLENIMDYRLLQANPLADLHAKSTGTLGMDRGKILYKEM